MPDVEHSPAAPRVSVCVPVRNGQRYLRPCLDSLLGQTFRDFELIICDNASTDGTEAICREYAARDPRIRYLRHAGNIGPAGNFNSGLDAARGEYFRWHAHDDLVEPEYLESCVRELDADRSVVLAHTLTRIIDEGGRPLRNYDLRLRTDSPHPAQRFGQLVLVRHRRHVGVEIFGLIRMAALRQTSGHGCYAHGDRVLLVRLSLLGRFVHVPRRLFLSRTHPTQSMQTLPDQRRSRLTRWLGPGPLPPPEWWDPAVKGKIVFPDWNLLRQYWISIRQAPLSSGQKMSCRLALGLWVLTRWPKLARDVIFAVETLLARAVRFRRRDDHQNPGRRERNMNRSAMEQVM